tara:strand:- start:3878 stop:5002 length:1125 start_codon:yes stop_codon:yes gene_type:complete
MAFRLGAAIGGAAKRASEILNEERKEAVSMTEDTLKTWTQLGLPKAIERRTNKTTNRKLAKQLKDNKFSVDQIAVIMGQGKSEEVLSYLDKQRTKYGSKYVIPHGDIVTISGTYEDTGLTIDKILENVQGKVNRGMSIGDAVQDTTGKSYTGGLTGLLGGDNTALMKQKMDAFGVAAGVDINELRALASDDITYDDPLRKGTISLSDPASEPIRTSLLNRFEQSAARLLGGKNVTIVDGIVQTPGMKVGSQIEANRIAIEANKLFAQIMSKGDTSQADALSTVDAFMRKEASKERNDKPGLTLDSLEDLDASQLPGAIESLLKGAKDNELMSMQLAAIKALKEAYLNQGTLNEAAAEKAAKEKVDSIIKNLNEV